MCFRRFARAALLSCHSQLYGYNWEWRTIAQQDDAYMDPAGDSASVDGVMLENGSTINGGAVEVEMKMGENANEEGGPGEINTGPGDLLIYVRAFFFISFTYLAFYFMIPSEVLPWSAPFATFLLWLASHVIGNLGEKFLGMPIILGMIFAGIFIRNIYPEAMQEFLEGTSPNDWSSAIRAAGLSLILMRSGLELDAAVVFRLGWPTFRLTVFPAVGEALVIGLSAMFIYQVDGVNMPFALSVTFGFIIAAVSPAIIITGMMRLSSMGYGTLSGIPTLVTAAAAFDDILAISGFSIASGFAWKSGSLLWSILVGPLNLVGGVALAFLCGGLTSLTTIFPTDIDRAAMTLILGLASIMFGRRTFFMGLASMGSHISTMISRYMWENNIPGGIWTIQADRVRAVVDGEEGELHNGLANTSLTEDAGHSIQKDDGSHFAHGCEEVLKTLWDYIFQPLLFATIGAAVNLRDMPGDTLWKAFGIIVIAVVVRMAMVMLATVNTLGDDGEFLNLYERYFLALAWIPKATVQAALGPIAVDYTEDKICNESAPGWSGQENCDRFRKWSQMILTTAVLSIVVTAPVGLLVIKFLGTRWLRRDPSFSEP